MAYSTAACIFSPSAFSTWLNAASSIAMEVKMAFMASSLVNRLSLGGKLGKDTRTPPK
jgi:hypothetical protein